MVPPPSYPGWANCSPLPLTSPKNLHEDNQLVSRRQDNSGGGEAGCLTSAGRVTLAGGDSMYKYFGSLTRDDFLRAT